jgi:hypothetical protein
VRCAEPHQYTINLKMARLKIVAPLFSRRSRDTDSIRRVFYYSNYFATCLVKTPMINPGRWRFPLVCKVMTLACR